MTNTGHHTGTSTEILTLPSPDRMTPGETAFWLNARTDDNNITHVTADIAGITLAQTTAAEYVIGQLFDDPDDAGDLDCGSVTGLGSGLVRVSVSFDAYDFITNHLCRTEGCEGDADCDDSYDGFCADCADKQTSDDHPDVAQCAHGDAGGYGNDAYPEVVAKCGCGEQFGPGWKDPVWAALADHIDANGGDSTGVYPWLRGLPRSA